MDTLKRSLAAKRRTAAGKRFEERLNAMHASYEVRKLGKVVPHYPRTVPTPRGRVFAKGGSPIDYSGVLQVQVYAFRHTDPTNNVPITTPFAIAFDAKVLGEEHASYTHSKEQRHQLLQLIAFHRGGALAFLLFEDRNTERLVIVHGLDTFDALLAGESVLVRGDPRWPRTSVRTGIDYDYRQILPQLLHR
jgi:penicillin-binding protein-related factor A (putative recombinase)